MAPSPSIDRPRSIVAFGWNGSRVLAKLAPGEPAPADHAALVALVGPMPDDLAAHGVPVKVRVVETLPFGHRYGAG